MGLKTFIIICTGEKAGRAAGPRCSPAQMVIEHLKERSQATLQLCHPCCVYTTTCTRRNPCTISLFCKCAKHCMPPICTHIHAE